MVQGVDDAHLCNTGGSLHGVRKEDGTKSSFWALCELLLFNDAPHIMAQFSADQGKHSFEVVRIPPSKPCGKRTYKRYNTYNYCGNVMRRYTAWITLHPKRPVQWCSGCRASAFRIPHARCIAMLSCTVGPRLRCAQMGDRHTYLRSA
jgi:hypothetical protein